MSEIKPLKKSFFSSFVNDRTNWDLGLAWACKRYSHSIACVMIDFGVTDIYWAVSYQYSKKRREELLDFFKSHIL
jgi:hypothetical protein